MVWDLRGALLKKQEVESARLADFEFRLRARTWRLVAQSVETGLSAADLVSQIALHDDDAISADIIRRCPALDVGALHAAVENCRATARAQLIAEIGDPSPHRLA